MKIEIVTSKQFKGQIQGTFNRPIISICRTKTGFRTFYLKYARTNNEFDGLLSEIICSELARKMNLNTPDVAIVEIGNHSIEFNNIIHHDRFKVGQKVFGSKRLEKADELSQLNFVYDKYDFNKLENPAHILRIGIFDLWIGNRDRKEDNFNLFLSQAKQQKYYIFDHFEAFNKLTENDQIDIPLNLDAYEGFLGSTYAYEMLGWVKKVELYEELEHFIKYLDTFNVSNFLNSVLKEIPISWGIKDETISYIERFLTSEKRIERIQKQVTDYIQYLPSKR